MNVIDSAAAFDDLPPSRHGGPQGFDMRQLLRVLVRGLPILSVTVLIGLSLGYVAWRYLPARYTSSVSILIDPKRPGAYGADAAFANLYVDGSKIASVEQIILSSELLEQVVQRQHLIDDPAFGGAKPSLFRRLSVYLSSGKVSLPPDTPAARMSRAVDHLGRAIRTARLGLTYVITVSVSAADAARAQSLAKAVGDAYLADQLNTKLEAARSDGSWLANRLQLLRRDLMTSESEVETVRQKYGLMQTDSAPGSTLDRQAVTELNTELAKAQADVAASEAKYNQVLRVTRSGGNLAGLSVVVGSKLIEDLRARQADANRRLADLADRYEEAFPERRQAERSRDTLNQQISIEISRIVDGLRNDYETAVARRDAVAAELKAMIGVSAATGSAQGRVALREAERMAQSNRAAYEAALNSMREVEQQETRQDVEARIISDAQLPDAPSFPRPIHCLGAGFGLGLFSGLALLFLLPRLQSRIVDAETIENSMHLPVLAMAPLVRKAELMNGRTKLSIPEYLISKPFSPFAESLRLLRITLRTHVSARGHVIQITSAVPGEGKSTVAASMAISAAAAGVRAVLVDLDFYNRAVTRLFGSPETQGVTDVLLGTASTGTALRTHDSLPLRIISAGSTGGARPYAIESAELRTLIAELSRDFDLVILDTPPVLAVSDPLLISGLADATIVVVGWRETPRDAVHQAISALRAARAPLVGMLLNKVDLAKAANYGGGYYLYKPYVAA
jgi:polysaccharide biosynthesis transport protein